MKHIPEMKEVTAIGADFDDNGNIICYFKIKLSQKEITKPEANKISQLIITASKFLELNKKLLEQFNKYEEVTGTIEEIRRLIEKLEGDE